MLAQTRNSAVLRYQKKKIVYLQIILCLVNKRSPVKKYMSTEYV